MRIATSTGDIARSDADVIVINLFEGVTVPGGATGAVDAALGGAIRRLLELGDLRGKAGELTLIHTHGQIPAARVLVAGLGKQADFDIDAIRNLSANVVRYLRRPGIGRVATIVHGAGIGGLDLEACAQAVAEGAILGSYRFLKHRSSTPDERTEIATLEIVEHDAARAAAVEAAARRGDLLGVATNAARDMANEPSNHLTPTMLAERAGMMVAATPSLSIQVLERADMEAKGMGSMLSVAKGSAQPPKMIRIDYRGKGGEGFDLAIVGKGITFDTGGISIKPAGNMDAMKADMTGAATVIAAMQAIAAMAPRVDVVAIAPCTENMPGGNATKPGDVVTAMNGTTIEILNTDAEGRLVLADGLCWAVELGARRLVDVATLTGAATTSFGDVCYGIMTNDDGLAGALEKAAAASGEKTWRLPMFKEYDDYVKSDVADIKNSGTRGAGTIVGAKFLERFVGKTPWVHLDIANVDMMDKDRGWVSKGASGYSVRTLINLALGLEQGQVD